MNKLFTYFYIFIAKTYLFLLKYLKIIFITIIFLFIAHLVLKDNTQTYTNIQTGNADIKKVLSNKYNKNNGLLVVDMSKEGSKNIKFYISETLNNKFQFKHLPKYNISYKNFENKNVFEIDFEKDITTSNIFVNNIFNSYLNNNKKVPSLENKNDYIIYFENNEENYFNDFFYKLLVIMNNENENKKRELFDLINDNVKPQKCSKIEVFFNINESKGRISLVCY
jgi:hypothetical protein